MRYTVSSHNANVLTNKKGEFVKKLKNISATKLCYAVNDVQFEVMRTLTVKLVGGKKKSTVTDVTAVLLVIHLSTKVLKRNIKKTKNKGEKFTLVKNLALTHAALARIAAYQ